MSRTIMKVRNPKLRWLAGFSVMAFLIFLGCVALYGIGRLAFWITETVSANKEIELSGVVDYAVTTGSGLLLASMFVSSVVLLIMVCVEIYDGAKALGEYLFDP